MTTERAAGLRERIAPAVDEWFETGYETGKLDTGVLADRLAALLADPVPLDVEESDVWLLPATAKGTAIGTDEWLRPLYVIRNLSSPDEMRPYGALAARLARTPRPTG